jgi:acetyl esterase/lipase
MAPEAKTALADPSHSHPATDAVKYDYDAELAAVLPFNVQIPFGDIAEGRRVAAKLASEQLRARAEMLQSLSVLVEDHVIPGSQHSADLKVRTYTPVHRAGTLGALLFFHGGGYVMGNLDSEEPRCFHLASRANCVVVSPDYRLAPEHPFPAGFDDCYRALCWVVEQSERLGVDAHRVAVGGVSSGGGLAASVAHRCRDEKDPELALQLLLFPTLDPRLKTASVARFTDTPLWDAPNNRLMWDYYLGSPLPSAVVPSSYAAPALAESFEDLPPAMMAIAEFDPLRDEALEYAMALLTAKVSVEVHLYPQTYHAFDNIAPFAQISQRALSDQVNSLTHALRT